MTYKEKVAIIRLIAVFIVGMLLGSAITNILIGG